MLRQDKKNDYNDFSEEVNSLKNNVKELYGKLGLLISFMIGNPAIPNDVLFTIQELREYLKTWLQSVKPIIDGFEFVSNP